MIISHWVLIKRECGMYKVRMWKVRIHGANVCLKCECANIKTGLSKDQEIVHTHRGESVVKNLPDQLLQVSCKMQWNTVQKYVKWPAPGLGLRRDVEVGIDPSIARPWFPFAPHWHIWSISYRFESFSWLQKPFHSSIWPGNDDKYCSRSYSFVQRQW